VEAERVQHAVQEASRSLTRLLAVDPAAMGVLSRLDERAAPPRHEFLRIAARDLVGLDGLEAVGANLAALADGVLRTAMEDVDGLAVIAMGKLGAQELNYASDIDVLFVGSGEAAARAVMESARSFFRVDADLRPEGRDGPLVRSLDSYIAYWDRWAQPWEFQALLKARFVAGDASLGAAFEAAAAERVWGRPFGADELRQVRSMKARAEGLVARRGMSERELKTGPGGIRDVEFAVQLLQLVHGGNDPALRVRATLPALRELARAGYVDPGDAAALSLAYTFLRTVEHRLQLVDEQPVHAVPADTSALARGLGMSDFDRVLRTHRRTTRSIHERLYFRPLLEAFAGVGTLTLDAADARLAAFGFADADRTRVALRELTRGLTRRSRLMQQMLPLVLGWLSDTPDPDLGLLGLRKAADSPAPLVATFRDSPEAARRLCVLLGTSRLFHDGVARRPEALPMLASDSELAAPLPVAWQWRDDSDEQRRTMLRWKGAEHFRIGARDVLGLDSVEETAAALTATAETVLDAALSAIGPAVPMAVVALGRFGGAELSYASDLDVLLVYDGDAGEVGDAGEELLRFVNGSTPAERIFTMDAGLRPEGRDGPLARSPWTGTARITSGGRRRGSARRCCGPDRWPDRRRWARRFAGWSTSTSGSGRSPTRTGATCGG
jgi:glutamate-ammonia-ligase adenylyltransferase